MEYISSVKAICKKRRIEASEATRSVTGRE